MAAAVRDLAMRGPWEGSASELKETLESSLLRGDRDRLPRDWPKSARGLTGALKRSAEALALIGVEVSDAGRDPVSRRNTYRIERSEHSDGSEPGAAVDRTANAGGPSSGALPHPVSDAPDHPPAENRGDRTAGGASERSERSDRSVRAISPPPVRPVARPCVDCGAPATCSDRDGAERCVECVSWNQPELVASGGRP